MTPSTSNQIPVPIPCIGLIIAVFSILVFAIIGFLVYVGYVQPINWSDKAPLQPAELEDDGVIKSDEASTDSWIIGVIVGVASIYLILITLILYCVFKKWSKERRRPDIVIDPNDASNLETASEEQIVRSFLDNILKFLARRIPLKLRYDFFKKLYSDEKSETVKEILIEVEYTHRKANTHERNFYQLKKWTTMLGTKQPLPQIKETLRYMQLEKILEQLESFVSGNSRTVKRNEATDHFRTIEQTPTITIDNFQTPKCQKNKKSTDSNNDNQIERSTDVDVEKHYIAQLKKQLMIQQLSLDSDSDISRQSSDQNAIKTSTESFLSVGPEDSPGSSEQSNKKSHTAKKIEKRGDSCLKFNGENDQLKTKLERSQNVVLKRKSSSSLFDHKTETKNTCGKKEASQPANRYRKSTDPQIFANEKSTSSSSSEYGNGFQYNRKPGRYQRNNFVNRKSPICRSHVKSVMYPKKCQQLLPLEENTHSSTLYLMKKLMKRGEEMIEKDYMYFMFHSVKQIMACTKECEDTILAITCEDFENFHKIESKSGHVSYIIDSADGFLPPLGFDEWECLELFKQQRDMVCQRKKDENDEFVGSVYMFISYDGRPVRKENDNDHCQNDEGENDESSLETTDISGQTPKQTQKSVLTDNKCIEYKKGISTQKKAEDNESVSDEDVESLLLNHPDTVRLPETSELAESLLSVLTDNTSQVIV